MVLLWAEVTALIAVALHIAREGIYTSLASMSLMAQATQGNPKFRQVPPVNLATTFANYWHGAPTLRKALGDMVGQGTAHNRQKFIAIMTVVLK